ncbi:MAG TPA: AraC family transcriptional regulator [Clostridiaceae bacterium]|nr:AraC family transcriptional regulator [Clostridiaceae bacterium]
MKNEMVILKNYFDNMQVNLLTTAYTKCWNDWREIDYIPQFNKFYYICDGEGWLKIGNDEYYPKPGELYLMPAGVLQSYSYISKNTFLKYWCHFTATVGDINIFDIIKTPLHIKIENRDEIENAFKELILSYKSTGITSSLRIKSELLGIIALFFENFSADDIHISSSSSVGALSTVMNYIEKNIGKNINVEELARLAGFHPNYFIKFFRKHLGISPMQYINRKRMEMAKGLIKATDMTISEIARRTGYKDPFYFSKLFKKYTGFSPSEYRKI